ncbi:hypothetical protein [Taibaiella koreensis]|uniref:hypothetical protein n=1 Tax=Taibaiella koreensis TaxID=1268548 RepID=UPI000E59EBD6|nr:hypothetical protein [Taibaiella koreensis]
MPFVRLYSRKFLLVILALQILNLSIYNTNFYCNNCFCSAKAQLKDANPIDSFAELMVEDVAGYQNAFPEPRHKNDKQSGELKHNISFKMVHQDHFARLPENIVYHNDGAAMALPGFCDNYSYLFWKEINHPPA